MSSTPTEIDAREVAVGDFVFLPDREAFYLVTQIIPLGQQRRCFVIKHARDTDSDPRLDVVKYRDTGNILVTKK